MGQKMYPKWQQAWDDKIVQIDQNIIDCCKTASGNSQELFDRVRTRLTPLLEQTGETGLFEPGTPGYQELQNKVQDRLQTLEHQGLIAKQAPIPGQQNAAGQPAAKRTTPGN